MKNIIEKLKEYNISFIYLNIMIYLLILIPKNNFGLGSIPVRIILIGVYILLMLYELKKGIVKTNKRKLLPFIIVCGLFILSTIPSLFVTYSLFTSLYTIVKFTMCFILFLLVYKTEFSDKEKQILVKNLLIASTLVILYGIACYIFDINLFKTGKYLYPGSRGRTESTFFNPIYFSIFINFIYTLFLYYSSSIKNKKQQIIFILLLSIIYMALIFTFTRSAILIFIVLFLMAIVLFRKIIFKVRNLIVILLIALITLIVPGGKTFFLSSVEDGSKMFHNVANFLPVIDNNSSSSDKYVDYDEDSEFTDYSLQHREAFSRIAKQIGKDNIPVGVGIGSYINYMESAEFDEAYPEYTLSKTHPHGAFVLLFAESSILSVVAVFAFFALVLLLFGITILKNFKMTNLNYYYASIGFIISCGFFAVNLIAENAIYDTQIFPVYLIIIGLLLSFSTDSKTIRGNNE